MWAQKMGNSLSNIDYKKKKTNPTLDSDTSLYRLPFFKDEEFFSNIDNYIGFIKSVENQVRTAKHYARYIKYIKEDVGLDFCQVLSNVRALEEDSTEIEMHHGPIFTLFDYASVITFHMLAHGKKVTTFSVANTLLQEHFDNHVQIVMLSKTVHEEVHNGEIFINTRQAFGDINAFFSKYRDGISNDMVQKINRHIEMSEKYDSFDNGALKLSDSIKSWARF